MSKPLALIVEDDRDIVALFRHVLDLAGYQTEIVLDGKAALEHLANSTPDIVLLDLNLPGASGGEILEAMHADERLKEVPVIVITALPELVKALTVRPNFVLIKPVNIEHLTNLLQQLCPTEKAMESLPWDVLTGVYDRSFFTARLKSAMDRARQFNQFKFAVLYLELEHSVKLDYLFGSEHNKQVLKESAVLLKTILRPTDTVTRLSGDLFAILLEDVSDKEITAIIGLRIQNRIRQYLAILESELNLRANVGVVICDTAYTTVDDILQAAENSLAQAKLERNKLRERLHTRPLDPSKVMDISSLSLQ